MAEREYRLKVQGSYKYNAANEDKDILRLDGVVNVNAAYTLALQKGSSKVFATEFARQFVGGLSAILREAQGGGVSVELFEVTPRGGEIKAYEWLLEAPQPELPQAGSDTSEAQDSKSEGASPDSPMGCSGSDHCSPCGCDGNARPGEKDDKPVTDQ